MSHLPADASDPFNIFLALTGATHAMSYAIQTLHYSGVWINAWHNIQGLGRALEMQQQLEYEAGIPSRIPYARSNYR